MEDHMEDHTFAGDTLVGEREVVMHSHSGGNPTLRKAHFLKPIFGQDHTHLPTLPSSVLSSKPTSQNLKKHGLRSCKSYPSEKWKIWVHSLKPKYQEIWKKAGIDEAILASTYKVPRDKDLILGLAERWCAETNTFVFSWGEVTLTLEDVMFLGGYSVLGALFLTPIPDECVGIFDSLKKVHNEIKLVYAGGEHASSLKWMEYFMCSGKDLEHEAFLAMWLSRFVLPSSSNDIVKQNFHVAIHLSRGNRIALAPLVLANVYVDMRLLQKSIAESINSESKVSYFRHSDLVQMWAWERFPELRPTPSVTERNKPRSARWNGVRILEVKDVRTALDSAKESFLWRPYVMNSSNCMVSKLYGDNEQWVVVESDDTESLARCLRVSELVGLGCIEKYLPHRVAMQFGLDQDVPPHVIRSNESPKSAWRNFNRSMRGMKLYIPPRLLDSGVSSRYVIWWRGLLPANEEMVTPCIQNVKHLLLIPWGHKRRRSRKIKSRKSKSLGKRNNLERLKTHYGPEPSAKRFCTTDPVIWSLQSMSSSDKSKEQKSCAERSVNLDEDAFVNNVNHAETNNVNIQNGNDEVGSKANCPEGDIVNIEEEGCDYSTSESPHLELMARIWRLEIIVDAIKVTKLNASSSGY